MDARIEWQIANADSVTVLAAGAGPRTVDLSSHPDGYIIRSPEPGLVRIKVANKFGELPLDLGEVVFYELPPFPAFSPGTLPRPAIPRLAEFGAERLRPVLEAVPAMRAPQLPAVPPLPTQELVGGFRDAFARGLPLPLPNLSEAVTEASRTIVVRTMNEALKYAAAQRPEYLAEPPVAGDDEE
jgi:hypothetical protein